MQSAVLIAGCGFVGLPLARKFLHEQWETHAITGSESSLDRLRAESFHLHRLDLRHGASFRHLPRHSFDVVIHCASSGRGNVDQYLGVFFHGTQNILRYLEYQHLIFCSSTSVYPQVDGSWVDELSDADPPRETGRILRRTEDLVESAGGAVARLAGLYGPGRCVPLEKIKNEEAIIEGDGTRILNLLHQSDAVSALRFLAELKEGGIFNVVDNQPVMEIDWYRYVCGRLDRALPPTGPRNLNRKRGWTSKRVHNKKLRGRGWEPQYPSFREGLESIFAAANR